MGEYSFILAIAGVLAAGAMSPGPSFMVVAQNSLSQSRAHGVMTALGTGLGVAFFALLASFGVTAILNAAPTLFVIFKVIGGLYLLYLAYKIWSGSSQPLETSDSSQGKTGGYWKAFMTGLVTQTSNPKTALVIAGIFSAFVPETPPPFTAIYVALVAFVIDFSWYAIVAFVLSGERSRSVYGKSKKAFDRTASVFLGLVGIKLMTDF